MGAKAMRITAETTDTTPTNMFFSAFALAICCWTVTVKRRQRHDPGAGSEIPVVDADGEKPARQDHPVPVAPPATVPG